MTDKIPPVLSQFRCYSTIFLNAEQAYLNEHMAGQDSDPGGHIKEAAIAAACKAVAQAQRDADAAYHEPLIQQAKEEGRKEVVEELRLRGDMSMNFPFSNIRKEAWQDILKELGIVG